MTVPFPFEAVPDGEVGVLHHFYWGGLLALFAAAVVWDDYRDREPVTLAAGTLVGLAFFGLWWPFYPVTGAAAAGLGTAVAVVGVGLPRWSAYWSRRWRAVAAVGVAAMVDDWLSHALGVWTPLDWAFSVIHSGGLVA